VDLAALLVAGIALIFALWSARTAHAQDSALRAQVAEAREGWVASFATARTSLEGLAEEVATMIDRAKAARSAANGAKGGRPTHEPAVPAFASSEEYLAYVARTGKTIPTYEQRFFGG